MVAGAGPAGTLSALYLARAGWDVVVCDKRSDATEPMTSVNILAYNICLNQRGIMVPKSLRYTNLLIAPFLYRLSE